MTLEEIKAYLDSHLEEPEVQAYVGGLITPDRITQYIEGDEGKRILQPKMDSYFVKGLETWKANNLQKIVDEEVSKRHPAETDEQKRIKALEQKIADTEKASARREAENLTMKALEAEGLPLDLVSFTLSDTQEGITSNIAKLKAIIQKAVEAEVDKKFKESGRKPYTGKDDKSGKKNPWSKETYNLTEQGRMLREDPETAALMMKIAKE